MVDKLLKASLNNPELLNSIMIKQLTRPNLIQAIQVLPNTTSSPPIFYSQLLSSLLRQHHKYNPSILAFKDFDKTSIIKSFKSALMNYFRIKLVHLDKFNLEDSLEMIETLTALRKNSIYSETASDLLEYFADLIIRNEWDLSHEQAIGLLRCIWNIEEKLFGTYTLCLICKATLFQDLSKYREDLKFYKRKDQFFELICAEKDSDLDEDIN